MMERNESLTAEDVTAILQLIDDSDFDEVTVQLRGLTVAVRRDGAPPRAAPPGPTTPPPPPAAPAMSPAPVQPPPPPVEERQSAPAPGEGRVLVDSPLLGTFYRAPGPGQPNFVEVGSEVEEETVVCIVEVMKMMNSVQAGARGRVVEVVANDGELVESGSPLFVVEAEED